MARKSGTRTKTSANVWEAVLATIQPEINPQSFHTWLKPTRLLPSSNGKLRVQVPNREFKEHIEEKFFAEIRRAAGVQGFKDVEFYPEIEEPPATVEVEEPDEHEPKRSISAFPVASESAWYGAAKEYRSVIGPRVECSDNFHLGCFLTMCGAALGKSVYINQGGIQYPNFYTVVVGASSWGRKSLSMDPIYDLSVAINPAIIPFSDLSSGEGLIRAIHDAGQQARKNDSQASVLVTLDEYNFMLIKGKQKGNTVVPTIKKAFGSPRVLEVPSSMRRVKVQDPPPFSMLAASETDDLADMDIRDMKGGLGNRTTFIAGERKPLDPDSTLPAMEEWQPLINRLAGSFRKYWLKGSSAFMWTKEAHKLWRHWYVHADKRGADDPLISKLAARHCVYVPKAALTFAALDSSDGWIDKKHLEAAIAWCDFLLESLYFVFRNADVKPWVKESNDIRDYVQRKGEVKYTQLQRRFHRLGPETFERRMKYLLADSFHPDRELRVESREGISGRQTRWVVPND